MALGRRKQRPEEVFIATAQLPRGPGHPFYPKLTGVLAEAQFDSFVEDLCAPYYKAGGRIGIPPGAYFRMLFVGYFEGLDSQRGIAWRCADSFALREFLGVPLSEATPVHASMTIIRQRLPETVLDAVFHKVLGLLRGKTAGVDATTLGANDAMKTIVRKATGANWQTYLRTLAKAEGISDPTAADLQRLDRARTGKKVSKEQWKTPHDPDARIAKMKDGTTHLAYKAEHAVDLTTEAIVAATAASADRGDSHTGPETLLIAQVALIQSGNDAAITEVVADKGYHDNRLLADCVELHVRTYIPERKQKPRRWTDKPAEYEAAFRANRRRVQSEKGRRLSRERCERTFAHVCVTGGGRRTWLRGLGNATKAARAAVRGLESWAAAAQSVRLGKPRSNGGWWGLFCLSAGT